jgi:hypothetical protein
MEGFIMALSYTSLSSGGGAASNDFTINVGTSGYTKTTLAADFPSGSYIVTSSASDTTLDIYLLNADGTLAAVVNSAAASFTISPTKSFKYVVVYGGTNNDTLAFVFKYVFAPTENSATDFTAVGPRIVSISPTTVANQNDTFTITGQNFATDVAITYTGTDAVVRNAKGIVRSSSTSLIVTRPDTLPPEYGPYTITASNPGITSPTSSNAHKSINTISAGANPVWVTGTVLSYTSGVSYNGDSLSATDADGSSTVTYSVASGTLPSGLSLASNGTISGTTSQSQITVTFRATDSGGNFLDKAIKFNASPVWTTTSLANATTGVAYSQTLAATDDTAGARTFSLVSGTLPAGLSLASNGVISGTPTNGNGGANLTFRATDGDGGFAEKVLTITTRIINQYLASSSWTSPSTVNAIELLAVGGGGPGQSSGGGGGGGVQYFASKAVTPSTTYNFTVGAAAAATTIPGLSVSANAGGSGGAGQQAGQAGGCGGGGSTGQTQAAAGGAGNQGGAGGQSGTYFGGGGGGGGGQAGNAGVSTSSGNGGNGYVSSITGSSVTYAGGGGARNGYSNPTTGGNGGGGRGFASNQSVQAGTNGLGGGGGGGSAAGGSGVIVLAYNF